MFFESRKDSPHGEEGQTLLIVVLVVIVASTIGLSLASRTITSLKTSTEEAESQKALAAAEAGIERSIQSNIPVGVNNNGPVSYRYVSTVDQSAGNEFLIYEGTPISKDGADVWFVKHNEDGSLDYASAVNPASIDLYWASLSDGATGACDSPASAPPAIEVIFVTRVSANDIRSYRYTYDSCKAERGNNFTLASTENNQITDNGKIFEFKYRTPSGNLANGISNIILMRVIPIYRDRVIIGLKTNVPLPLQGYLVTSTGTSGQASRKIRVFKGWPQTYLPYLSYGLFVAQ